jgi:hypothetical protein
MIFDSRFAGSHLAETDELLMAIKFAARLLSEEENKAVSHM